MKRLIAAVAVALAACAAIAIFGHPAHKVVVKPHVTVTTPKTTTTTVTPTAHPCSASDQTMSCVLAGVGKPEQTYSLLPGQQYGVDFGWGGVAASYAKRIGAQFGASYLSPDGSKNWTAALVNSYHALGLKTVAVWESSATRAEEGYAAGRADAIEAKAQAAALGNTTRPILFAIDCECSGSSVLAYFQGVHSVLGARDDAYGDYDVILYLHAEGVVGNENWETYAWSGGRWLPASIAPLEQYLNGSAFDNDRAIAPLYGQWPGSSPVSKPKTQAHRAHWTWLPRTLRHFAHGVKAREREAVRHWDQADCRTPVKRASCRTARAHMILLRNRIASIANHTANLKHRAKHPRWKAVHYRTSGHTTTLGGAYQQLAHRLSKKNHGVVTHW